MKIIIGQECIVHDGLGRVAAIENGICDSIRIKVDTYINNRGCTYDSTNVQLINPVKYHREVSETRMIQFKDLPKGARFNYPDCTSIWVVLEAYGNGLIAKWEGLDSDRRHQSICSFCDDEYSLDSEVEVTP